MKPEPQRPVDFDFLLKLRFPSQLKVSPDGKKAAFILSKMDEAENRYRSDLWLYDGQIFRRLTSDGGVSDFIWDGDGQLLFPAKRAKAEDYQGDFPCTDYYRLPLDGGEAVRAFRFPYTAQNIVRCREGLYAISALVPSGCEGKTALPKDLVLKNPACTRELTELPFWENGAGWVQSKRQRLFLFEEKGRTIPVNFDYVDEISLSRDGKKLYVLHSKQEGVRGLCNAVSEYRFSDPGETSHGAGAWTESYPNSFYEFSKIWETEDERVFVLASDHRQYPANAYASLYELDAEKGVLRPLSDERFEIWDTLNSDIDYGGSETSFVKDGNFYFLASDRDHSVIYRIDGEGKRSAVFHARGALRGIQPWKDGFLAIGLLDITPSELYYIRLTGSSAEVLPLSSFHEALLQEYCLIRPQRVEGAGIDGWFLPPLHYQKGKRYPAILDIHGGPATAYGAVLFHEMQYWSAQGYFVLYCNPHGSSACGEAFSDIRGRYGTIDYDDIMSFLDTCLKQLPDIDEERLGVTGGSYGGFMCNWILGHSQRFKAIATQRSISNWISFAGVSDIGYFFAAGENGTELQAPDYFETLWKHSPLKYVRGAMTPTLILHSEEDYRCPVEQAYQLFSLLKSQSTAVEMILFRGENHELSRSGKPLARRERLEKITGWMDRYLKAPLPDDTETASAL